MNEIIEKDELMNLVPHKGKMFLLSRVTSYDCDKHCIDAEFDITRECIFHNAEHDGIPSYCTFEIMAQGISCLTGITNRILGKKPLDGCILSVSDFVSEVDFFKSGTTIYTRVVEEFRDDESHVYGYDCALFNDVERLQKVVSVKITVMETEDIKKL